ncbi:MAG: desulfoferrodoxin [Oscillospiraceae bacterium]|jgi:superoxide reductase|nr:desulfoferrodoxin [Oscillospiraceae bacterium]
MKNEVKFYRCPTCGNIIMVVNNGGGQLVCCGAPMVLLRPNTTDAATEKHVPVAQSNGNVLTVSVGDVPHPMLPEHYIQWVYLVTENGGAFHYFNPGDEPQVDFDISNTTPVAVYEYCNLHGLWKADIAEG